MARVLFIGSTEKMTENAQRFIEERGMQNAKAVFLPASKRAEALELVNASGAQIIIARGLISASLKKHTDLPVVEIVITAQEMGLKIVRAKALIGHEKPTIAVVGISKMFCNMRDFDEIFDITLITEFVDSTDELFDAVNKALSGGAELIIGGEIVGKHAQEIGIPYLVQPDGSDSIEQAFRIADSMAWTAEREKKNAAELRALLDFSSNGIIKLDREGNIISFNDQALSLLDKAAEEVEGRHIKDVIEVEEARKALDDVFFDCQEAFFTFWHSTGVALAINAVPLLVDGLVVGIMLSMYGITKLRQIEAEARRELYQSDNEPRSGNTLVAQLYADNLSFLRSAKRLAQFDECVLLSGSHPAEREIIARYIHAVSLRRDAPFIFMNKINLQNISVPNLELDADNDPVILKSGTYFIDEVEKLSSESQSLLYRLLSQGLRSMYTNLKLYNIQFILGTQTHLVEAVQDGLFREDLFHIISALTLDMPALENSSNGIQNCLTYFLQQYLEMYSTKIHITKSARSAILSHPWKGGIAELRSFCCNAVINTPKSVLDESTATRFLRKNPLHDGKEPSHENRYSTNQEATKLKQLIEKYDGNRGLIADDMHISLSTLWRRMKKYGLI